MQVLKRLTDGYFALVILCVFGIFTIGYISVTFAFSQGYQSADQEHATYYAERDTEEKNYRECLNISIDLNSARECVDQSETTSRDAERSEQDLNAQREMAQWAKGMLWAAWLVGTLTFLATVIGVRYVYLTLVSTREMVRDTKKIGQAQTRAYLSIVPNSFDAKWNIGQSVVPEVYFNIKNSGISPAKDVKIAGRLWVEGCTFPVNGNDLFKIDQSDEEAAEHIAADETATVSAYGETNLVEGFFDQIFASVGQKLCLYGIIFYTDVFDMPQKTRFCYSANIGIVGHNTLDVTSWRKEHNHNDAT